MTFTAEIMVRPGKTSRPVHPLEGYLGYQLRRAAAFMQTDMSMRLSELDLTMVEMSILLVVQANPLITQSQIGRMLAIKRANMAPLSGGLQARGLLDRQPVDGRSNGLVLTPAGAEMTAACRVRIEENEALLFRAIPSRAREPLLTSLGRIWDRGEDPENPQKDADPF